MTDRPIIFSGPMVRALLDGRKTQTRRVVKSRGGISVCDGSAVVPYTPGDRLWVRESVAWVSGQGWRYRADNDDLNNKRENGEVGRWHLSSRLASRITLTVTEVRVQRLWLITNNDAIAEGIKPQYQRAAQEGGAVLGWGYDGLSGYGPGTPKAAFALFWNSLHGPDAWEANPWVVACTFTVENRNIDK